MSEEYIFIFHGTKAMFLDTIKQFPNNDNTFFYFNDYIIELNEDKIRFGIERSGHSSGYWFTPTITEVDNQIEFSGTIHYVDSHTDEEQHTFKRAISKFNTLLLSILLLPLALILKLFDIIKCCIGKLLKQSKPTPMTTEDRLYDLMEKHLNCVRIP